MSNVYFGENVEDFIFDESATYEEGCKKETDEDISDEEMNEFGVMECFEDPEVACFRIALENEQNYNAIMNAMMIDEMVTLESGMEVVYESGKISKFLEKVQAQIGVFWAKIKGVFKRAVERVGSFVATNKAFVAKYKGKPMGTPKTDKDFKGYKFPHVGDYTFDRIYTVATSHVDPGKIGKISEEQMKSITNGFEIDDIKGEMRAKACGQSGKIDGKEFSKELKKYIFGSEKKETIGLQPFNTLINTLETAKKDKEDLKTLYKAAEKVVKDMKKDVNEAKKNLTKEETRKNAQYGVKLARHYTNALNASLNIMATAMHMVNSAVFTRTMQARAQAMFYVNNQHKVEGANESAFDNLDNVVLV